MYTFKLKNSEVKKDANLMIEIFQQEWETLDMLAEEEYDEEFPIEYLERIEHAFMKSEMNKGYYIPEGEDSLIMVFKKEKDCTLFKKQLAKYLLTG